MAGVLFEDIFDVKDIDPEGKKFDRGESKLRKYVSLMFKFLSNSIRALAGARRIHINLDHVQRLSISVLF